jgi:tryptophanyl-tRNA synthetase
VLIVQEETPVVGVPAAYIEEETAVAPAITMEIEEVAAAEQVVTPWEVSAPDGVIDYDKLVDRFGCQLIDAAIVDRIAHLTLCPPLVSSGAGSSSPTGDALKTFFCSKQIIFTVDQL